MQTSIHHITVLDHSIDGLNARWVGQHMGQAHLLEKNPMNGNEANPLDDRSGRLTGLSVNWKGARSTDET